MATRTARRTRRTSRTTHRTPAARGARLTPNGRTRPESSRNGAGRNGGSARGWDGLKATYDEALAESRQRPGLYPFTISGVPIKALYTHEDIAHVDPARDLAVPGEYPYTRGIHTSMYRGRMFTMRQFA